MKICILTHNIRQDNGAGVFSRRLIEGVRKAADVEVFALTTAGAGEPYETPILYPRRTALLSALPLVRSVIKKCDVVHALDAYPYGLVAVIASWGLSKKIIITATGSNSIEPLYRPILGPLVSWAYKKADRLSAISSFTKAEIEKKVSGLKMEVINHGVDAEFFAGADGLRYDVSRFKPYILGVGQLRWRKGYHFSIRAFAKVRERFPDLNYVIVGKRYKDDYYLRLQKLIDELSLRERVFILEDVRSREELADVYKGAELFCLFSQNVNHDVEGFGLVFLEAAAAGLAVVGSKNCGIDDAVRDGKNGLLVPTRNPDDFAGAITAILCDPQRKKVMAEASLALAREMTWDKQIVRYQALYKRAA
jgi:phosphatidylinositol alpha-1,6-mannosyltransferase